MDRHLGQNYYNCSWDKTNSVSLKKLLVDKKLPGVLPGSSRRLVTVSDVCQSSQRMLRSARSFTPSLACQYSANRGSVQNIFLKVIQKFFWSKDKLNFEDLETFLH